MPCFRAPFIRGAYWVHTGLRDPVYVVTVPEGGRKSGVVRFLFRRNGAEMSPRSSCGEGGDSGGEGGDSCEGGGQWLDGRVLEEKSHHEGTILLTSKCWGTTRDNHSFRKGWSSGITLFFFCIGTLLIISPGNSTQ